jgi:hypothetical protein
MTELTRLFDDENLYLKLLNPVSLIRQVIKFYDEPESLQLFDAATKVSGMGSSALPKDLIRIGMRMHLRGLLNTLAIQSNRDWVWPFWVERQFNPRLKGFQPRSHSLSHINLTHRNWTILGALGNSHRAVVDPCGLITPWLGGWSLDCWLATQNKLQTLCGQEGITAGTGRGDGSSKRESGAMASSLHALESHHRR